MKFKIFSLVVIFGIILMQGVSAENVTGVNLTGTEKLEDKKEMFIQYIDLVIDDKGIVHLSETILLTPTFDNKGIKGEILIPKDAKDSLSIFYELGGSKLNFESKSIDDKELVTMFFPESAKPEYLFNWNNVPGSDSEWLINFMENNLNKKWAENAKIKKTDDGKTITITEEYYLFNWNNIPGGDSKLLLELLENDLKMDWVRNAEIRKSNDNKTITVASGENLTTLYLDEEQEKVTIETDETSGGHTYEYLLEKENGNLNIYKKGENAIRFKLEEDVGKAILEVLKFEYKEKGKNLTLETIVKETYEYSLKSENGGLNIYEPVESQLVIVDYNTYQFISTSGGVGTLNFSLPTTPDVTAIDIKFPEESKIIPQYIPDSTISSGNELKIRSRTNLFNLAYQY